MSKHDKSLPRKPYYVEQRFFDNTYRPRIWWCDSKPTETSVSGQKLFIQNVHELSMDEAGWPLESLYEMFNPESAE